MLKSFACALSFGAALLVSSAPARAIPVHYDLTFTPTWGSATGGAGVLTLDLPGIPTDYLGLNGSSAEFVSLTATVNGLSFAFSDPKVWWLGMANGVWNTISAESDPSGGGSFPFVMWIGGLGYGINQINVGSVGGGTIAIGEAYLDQPPEDVVTATPLPGTLPLFAGGLGALALLARRFRRTKI